MYIYGFTLNRLFTSTFGHFICAYIISSVHVPVEYVQGPGFDLNTRKYRGVVQIL